jgi:hypothetical protein
MAAVPFWWVGPIVQNYQDAFRLNVAAFLRTYGTRVNVEGLGRKITVYVVPLKNSLDAASDSVVHLHVYEERLGEERTNPTCDMCRNMGG